MGSFSRVTVLRTHIRDLTINSVLCVTNSIMPKFTVCDTVQLGRPLPPISEDTITQEWQKVASNNTAFVYNKDRSSRYVGREFGSKEAPTPGKIETNSKLDGNVIAADFSRYNMLAWTVYRAFYEHYPITLSPDVIWITIAQGFAQHVNNNAEDLRSCFVEHEGKKQIVISRPEFVKGSPNNDWPGVFPEFSEKIAANVKDPGLTKVIECTFSTTGPVEQITSQITLMDSMKSYFEYVMMCGCGIPSVELTGTVEDWRAIKQKALALREYDLEWWIDELVKVLDHFIL